MTGSEVSHLRQHITLVDKAAQEGLSGLASGVSRHDFIEARMNRDLERFVQLVKDGNIEQVDKEVTLMKIELQRQERMKEKYVTLR